MTFPLFIKEPFLFIIIAAVVPGWGFALEKLLSLKIDMRKEERLAVHLAGGMFFISFIFLILGLMGFLDYGLGYLIIILGLVFFYFGYCVRYETGSADAEHNIKQKSSSILFHPLSLIILALISGVMLFHLLACFLADIGGDSMNYHLSIPKLYLMKGKIFALPYHACGNMYLGASMVYMWGLTLDSWGVVCKYLQWLQIAGTIILVYSMMMKILSSDKDSKEETVWIHLLSLSATAIFIFNLSAGHYKAPIHVRSDLTGMFYLTAAMNIVVNIIHYSGIIKTEEKFIEEAKKWIYAGILIAAAGGVKYTTISFGLIPFFIALIFTKFRFQKSSIIRWDMFLFCGTTAFLLMLPWILRSWITTGSPAFPMFDSMIKPEYRSCLSGISDYQEPLKKELAEAIFNIPAFIRIQYQKIYPALLEGDILLGIIPVVSLIFLFSKKPVLFFISVFTAGSFLIFMYTPLNQIARLFIVVSPFTTILLTVLLFHLLKKSSMKKIMLSIICLAFFACFIYHQRLYSDLPNIQWHGKPQFSVESRRKYVREFCYMHDYIFPVYDYIDGNLKKDSLIYMVGQPLPFYCPRPFISQDYWNPAFHHINKLYRDSERNIDILAKKFKGLNVTHILVNTDQNPFLEFDLFLKKHFVLLKQNNYVRLYIFQPVGMEKLQTGQ